MYTTWFSLDVIAGKKGRREAPVSLQLFKTRTRRLSWGGGFKKRGKRYSKTNVNGIVVLFSPRDLLVWGAPGETLFPVSPGNATPTRGVRRTYEKFQLLLFGKTAIAYYVNA